MLGANGMAGHVTCAWFRQYTHYAVIGATREGDSETPGFDATIENSVEHLLEATKPDYVVNCVGVLVKEASDYPERAIRTNSLLPRLLERRGRESKFRTIHLSTDCVFSGNRGHYHEDDFRDGDDMYARTKALGELNNERDLTIRTSIIGPELGQGGSGLFHWFMMQNGEVGGYTRTYWSGVTTIVLAAAIEHFLKKETRGLVHLTNGQPISKFHLLEIIKEIWHKADVTIAPNEGKVSDKSLVSTRTDVDFEVPEYHDMLLEMKTFMQGNHESYQQYLS